MGWGGELLAGGGGVRWGKGREVRGGVYCLTNYLTWASIITCITFIHHLAPIITSLVSHD